MSTRWVRLESLRLSGDDFSFERGKIGYASSGSNDDDGQGNSFFAVTKARGAESTRRMAREFELAFIARG